MSSEPLSEKPRFWSLACAEPYRVFFPLGWIWALIGTWYWLAFSQGWSPIFQPAYHGYLQVLGFGGCFAIGFLFTALPFFLNAPTARSWELLAGLGLAIAGGALLTLDQPRIALLAFALLWLHVAGFLSRRYRKETGAPPPVTLIGWGMANAIVGISIILFPLPAFPRLGPILLEQGMLLTFMLGIGSFLGARFMGTFQPPAFLFRSRSAPPPVILKRVFMLNGLLMFASFWMEAGCSPAAGRLIRASVVSFQFLALARVYRLPQMPGWPVRLLWLSYWFAIIGTWIPALWAKGEITALHVLFIGGYGFMILAIGIRVITSHGGWESFWTQSRAWVWLVAATGSLAIAARVSAMLFPLRFMPLLGIAAASWLFTLLVWGVTLLPRVARRSPTS